MAMPVEAAMPSKVNDMATTFVLKHCHTMEIADRSICPRLLEAGSDQEV
jgi:hypothetical protein